MSVHHSWQGLGFRVTPTLNPKPYFLFFFSPKTVWLSWIGVGLWFDSGTPGCSHDGPPSGTHYDDAPRLRGRTSRSSTPPSQQPSTGGNPPHNRRRAAPHPTGRRQSRVQLPNVATRVSHPEVQLFFTTICSVGEQDFRANPMSGNRIRPVWVEKGRGISGLLSVKLCQGDLCSHGVQAREQFW